MEKICQIGFRKCGNFDEFRLQSAPNPTNSTEVKPKFAKKSIYFAKKLKPEDFSQNLFQFDLHFTKFGWKKCEHDLNSALI